jgi:hypothetical protein
MPGSDPFGDSDDEALIIAATQAGAVETQDTFDEFPRPAKRRRVVRDVSDTDDGNDSSELSSGTLEEFDVTQADTHVPDDEEQENCTPQKPRHQFHNPKLVANLDRIIVTHTQVVAPSQPWMIRGPVWRKPKSVGDPRDGLLKPNPVVRGSEDAMRQESSEDDEIEVEGLMDEIIASNVIGGGTKAMQM